MNRHIIYHQHCTDGFCSAWLANMVLEGVNQMYAINPNDPFPATLSEDDEVYIVDISFPPDILEEISTKCREVFVYDHHVTAIRKFEGWLAPDNVHMVLDESRCGSKITYDELVLGKLFLNPLLESLVMYVQDCDLWEWKLENSEEINAYLNLVERNIDSWNKLLKESKEIWLDKGRLILQQQNRIVESHVERVVKITWQGYQVGLVNATYYQSPIGASILDKHSDLDLSVIFMFVPDGVKYSLRSRKNGDVDVTKIAEQYGGGGHPSAAGFFTKRLISFMPYEGFV